MPLSIPNFADATYGPQAEPDSRDIDAIVAAIGRTGVQVGLTVSQRGAGANMSVDVATGTVVVASTSAVAASVQNVVVTADGTFPRFTLIVSNASGVASAIVGTPAAAPAFPTFNPATQVLLGAVYIPAGAGSIVNANVVDKRVMLDTVYSPSNANLASTVVSATSYGIGSAVGSGTAYARNDHTHGTPATPVTSAVAGTGIGVSGSTGAVTISNTGVTSVAGRTGAVSLTAADIGAGTFPGANTFNGFQTFAAGSRHTTGQWLMFGMTSGNDGYISGISTVFRSRGGSGGTAWRNNADSADIMYLSDAGTLQLAAPSTIGLEIGRTDGVASTPFIDFHSGATGTDYDVRLQASGGTGATGGGLLTVFGALTVGQVLTASVGLTLPNAQSAVFTMGSGSSGSITGTPGNRLLIVGGSAGVTVNNNANNANILTLSNTGDLAVFGALSGAGVETLDYGLRAGFLITGGGTVSFDGSGNFGWTARFITIGGGNGVSSSTSGYFDITQPTSGALNVAGGATARNWSAAGVLLNAWEALWYVLPIGATSGTVTANFWVTNYTAGMTPPAANWVLLATRNGDGTNYLRTCLGQYLSLGMAVAPGQLVAASSVIAGAGVTLGTAAQSGPGIHSDGTNLYIETGGLGTMYFRARGPGAGTNQGWYDQNGQMAAVDFAIAGGASLPRGTIYDSGVVGNASPPTNAGTSNWVMVTGLTDAGAITFIAGRRYRFTVRVSFSHNTAGSAMSVGLVTGGTSAPGLTASPGALNGTTTLINVYRASPAVSTTVGTAVFVHTWVAPSTAVQHWGLIFRSIGAGTVTATNQNTNLDAASSLLIEDIGT